jgi:hypothetical protein
MIKVDKSGRYYLFAYEDHYPAGGMDDCLGRFDSHDEAFRAAKSGRYLHDNMEIYDSHLNKIRSYERSGIKNPIYHELTL